MMRQRSVVERLSRYVVFAALSITLGAGVWLERAVLLRAAADLWIVSDAITPADAVVVIGGGLEVRPFAAADLYEKGLVHKVLVSRVADDAPVSIGAVPSHAELNIRILRELGVPDGAIEAFGDGSKTTLDEAIALKGWTMRHPTAELIIPVEPFFARRASWIFRREFAGTAVRIEVASFDPPSGYSRAEWWKTAAGVIAFQNEVVKYIYYRWSFDAGSS